MERGYIIPIISNDSIINDDIKKDDLTKCVLLVFSYLHDIIHIHIYTFILFVIYKNIEHDHFEKFIKNIIILGISHILLIPALLDIFLKDNESIILRLINTFKYIIILEFIAYWYHRLVHIKLFYNYFHKHDFIGTPYNYLLRTKYDILAQIVYIYFPLKIIPMNYNDFMCIYFFYIFIGFLSNTINQFKIHKETRKYNYALGFPLYDYIFGTYLSESRYLLLQEHNS
jgi:sterol desaturase/sphingolipid hydroxylase (fatty acid hydroxylase superfamily)